LATCGCHVPHRSCVWPPCSADSMKAGMYSAGRPCLSAYCSKSCSSRKPCSVFGEDSLRQPPLGRRGASARARSSPGGP
jgi:hypothetical protein